MDAGLDPEKMKRDFFFLVTKHRKEKCVFLDCFRTFSSYLITELLLGQELAVISRVIGSSCSIEPPDYNLT